MSNDGEEAVQARTLSSVEMTPTAGRRCEGRQDLKAGTLPRGTVVKWYSTCAVLLRRPLGKHGTTVAQVSARAPDSDPFSQQSRLPEQRQDPGRPRAGAEPGTLAYPCRASASRFPPAGQRPGLFWLHREGGKGNQLVPLVPRGLLDCRDASQLLPRGPE